MMKDKKIVATPEVEGDRFNWFWVCSECHGGINWNEPKCPWCNAKIDWSVNKINV